MGEELGIIGGMIAILWSFIGYFIDGYEQFRYESSVITAIYPISPLQQNMYEEYERDPLP